MAWYYLYDAATGRLISECTEEPGARAGVAVATRGSRCADGEMWDEATRSFVARPAKVLVDRIVDLENDPALSAVWSRLTVTQRQTLKTRLGRLLGRHRFRHPDAPVDIPTRGA